VPSVFYFLLAAMLIAYAILDGFDFGAGILHLFVAKNDVERRTVFAAIGPVWDGNEVWLIASGGVLFFAFPRAYASALSGLYLPLMLVLWTLIGRGISIEFRSKLDHPLWRAGFDGVFAIASSVMAVVLGTALGNLVRGVPVDEEGWFHEDLFTDFRMRSERLGAIDLYTLLVGIFALVALATHGATYLVWKTSGVVNERSSALARRLWPATLGLGALVTAATAMTQPEHFATFARRPWIWPMPLLAVGGAVLAMRALRERKELRAFGASCTFLGALLAATAFTLFPVILRSTTDPRFTLDAENASSIGPTLVTGLAILAPAVMLGIGYFVYVYRSFRGKVTADDGHG
jgi:cytochrome d ubiquinol oxidase subunit II